MKQEWTDFHFFIRSDFQIFSIPIFKSDFRIILKYLTFKYIYRSHSLIIISCYSTVKPEYYRCSTHALQVFEVLDQNTIHVYYIFTTHCSIHVAHLDNNLGPCISGTKCDRDNPIFSAERGG